MKNTLIASFLALCLGNVAFGQNISVQVSNQTDSKQCSKEELTLSDKITPINADNIFKDADYYNWCSSIIKGEDGKYHIFYSRWERSKTFFAWLTHSTIAHAVADKPEGPYTYVKTVIDFNKDQYNSKELLTAHNPKIKYFEGKYYIYFCSTHLDEPVTDRELIETAKVGYSHEVWKPLRKNQRTYVASSSSLDGEWKIDRKPLLEPYGPITTLVVNPAITQGKDNRYYLIIKGDKPGTTRFERNQALAISTKPDSDFKIMDKPVIGDWDTEDVSMWYDKKTQRYYAVFHAHTYIGMMTSVDGETWEKAIDYEVIPKSIPTANNGEPIIPDRMERPFVYTENDKPQVLSLAIKKGNDTYILTIPLRR